MGIKLSGGDRNKAIGATLKKLVFCAYTQDLFQLTSSRKVYLRKRYWG